MNDTQNPVVPVATDDTTVTTDVNVPAAVNTTPATAVVKEPVVVAPVPAAMPGPDPVAAPTTVENTEPAVAPMPVDQVVTDIKVELPQVPAQAVTETPTV